MSRLPQPRSILKKTTASPPPPAETREERNRALALHHAGLIQQRKDVEASVFSSLEALLDYPTSFASADPARPSPADVIEVKRRLKQFQPSDYDSLVEERNIDNKCGYVLCPRPPQPVKRLRGLIRGGADGEHGARPVPLGRYCGQDCAKRALFQRVQLSETPAWERYGQHQTDIELYGESEELPRGPGSEDEVGKLAGELRQLAIERGEMGNAIGVEVSIRENSLEDNYMPEAPSLAASGTYHHSFVEGYAATGNWQQNLQDDDGDDIMDTI